MIDWKNIKDKFVVCRNGGTYKVVSYKYNSDIKYRHNLFISHNFVFDCEKYLPVENNSYSASFLDNGHYLDNGENSRDIIKVIEYIPPIRIKFVPDINDILVLSGYTKYIVVARKISFGGNNDCLNLVLTEQDKPLSPFRVLSMDPQTGRLFGGQRIIEVIRNNEKIYRYDSKPETFGMF